ncbi:hypothetical protein PCANB_002945 [Pneumocystis canis]|nr:hypothetical protein PCANB_002945 [Pneumocystis canis]
MVSISEPYFLTKLPYPVNSEFTKQCHIAKVFPKGCQEIVVAINEIGINIYNANSGQIITNYPVDRNTQFSCAPISLRAEMNENRLTIAGSIETITGASRLLLWNEKSNLDEVQFKFIDTKSEIINIQLLKDRIITFFKHGEIIQYNYNLDVICEIITNIPNTIKCGQIRIISANGNSVKNKEKGIVYKVSLKNSRTIIINIFQICETVFTKLNTIYGILVTDFNINHRITLTDKNVYHLTPTHLFTYMSISSNLKLKSKIKLPERLSIPIFIKIIHNFHVMICSANKILLFDTVHQVFFFSKEVVPINTEPVIIHTYESSRIQNSLLILSNTEFLILSTISSSKNSLLINMLGKVNDKEKANCMVISSISNFEKKETNKLILESFKKTKKCLNEQKRLVNSFLIKLEECSLLKDGNAFDNIFFKHFDTENFTKNLFNKNPNNEKNDYTKSYTQNKKIQLSPLILDKIIQMIFLPSKKENIFNSDITKLQILFYPKKTLNYLVSVTPLSLLKTEYSGLINSIIDLDSSLLLNLLLNSDFLPPKELASALKYLLNKDFIDLKIFKRILKMIDNYTGEQVVSALKTELTGNEIEKLINLLGKQISLKTKPKSFKQVPFIGDELVIYGMLENSLDTIGICGITIQNINSSFFDIIYDVEKTINEIINLNNIVSILDELICRAGGHKNIDQKYREFKFNKINQNKNTNDPKKKSNPQLHNAVLLNQLPATSTLQENNFKTRRTKSYQKGLSVEKYSIERLEL